MDYQSTKGTPWTCYLPHTFRGILAGKTENREILFRYSDQRPSGRSYGRTIEHYSRRTVKSRIFSTLFVCRWLQGRSAILSRTEKRRTATGGVRRIDVYRQSGSTMDTCQDFGISYRRGCRIAGRLTNDICRYRRGMRYDQPVGHLRSTEGNIY